MIKSFLVSDIHGNQEKYNKLFAKIQSDKPLVVFFAGDLYPSQKEIKKTKENFFDNYFLPKFESLKLTMKASYPKVFIILGNDDPMVEEYKFSDNKFENLWTYLHLRTIEFMGFNICGYSFIPPSPFLVKDWELYDVSRYVDPGCIHPIDGKRFIDPKRDIEYSSIKKDLDKLFLNLEMNNTIFLFHSPPYKTNLDRAALDNQFFDHVPLDVHIGSIAIKEFIETNQPYLSLHGHVHESTRITGKWKDEIENTISFNAANDDKLLSLIIFDLKNLLNAERQVL